MTTWFAIEETAAAIRSAFTGKIGEQTRIAQQFDVPLSVVHNIVRGKTYAHLRV